MSLFWINAINEKNFFWLKSTRNNTLRLDFPWNGSLISWKSLENESEWHEMTYFLPKYFGKKRSYEVYVAYVKSQDIVLSRTSEKMWQH